MAEAEAKVLTTIEMIEKVKDTDEFKTLVSNQSKQYIGGELKTVWSSFDQSVKDNLGLDKPEDEKSLSWVNKHLSRIPDLEKELETLKSKGEDGNKEQNKLWSDKFEKLKTQLTTKEKELVDITQKGFNENISNQLDTFLVGKTFKPSYSEDDLATLIEAKKAKIISNTKTLENGKVAVFNVGENKYYTDTLGEPLTPIQVAKLEFEKMFHVKTAGGDTPPNDDNKASIEGEVLTMDMNIIKSRGDFYNLFKKLIAPKGLASHDEKYLTIQRATMEHYKINALPLS